MAIARGRQRSLALGNLDGQRDWGYAPDYTRAMRLILVQSEPDELVIATGQSHRVRDWCDRAFGRVGLDDRQHVTTESTLWRPAPPVPLVGKSEKAHRLLKWTTAHDFQQLVDLMMDAELATS